MFGSSGWWNWSITCGCGGPMRRAKATNCAALSDCARNGEHLVRIERALEFGKQRVVERLRQIDAGDLDAKAVGQGFAGEHGVSPVPVANVGAPMIGRARRALRHQRQPDPVAALAASGTAASSPMPL